MPNESIPEKRRKQCVEIAQQAAVLLKERYGDPGRIEGKGIAHDEERVYDVVTEVDYLSEALILKAIKAIAPESLILAEEGGYLTAQGEKLTESTPQLDGELWLIDPLDGTINFAHGVPHFCVSIATWQNGVPVAGAVIDPIVDECFSFAWDSSAGANDRAAYHNEMQVKLQPVQPENALICIGGTAAKQLAPILPQFRSWRRLGSAALALSWVGIGRSGGYLQPGNLNAWDWGAGAPFVLAAGGEVARPNGAAWPPAFDEVSGVVATAPGFHDKLLQEVVHAMGTNPASGE